MIYRIQFSQTKKVWLSLSSLLKKKKSVQNRTKDSSPFVSVSCFFFCIFKSYVLLMLDHHTFITSIALFSLAVQQFHSTFAPLFSEQRRSFAASSFDSEDDTNNPLVIYGPTSNVLNSQLSTKTPDKVMVVPMFRRPLFPWQYAPLTVQDLVFTMTLQEWKKQHQHFGFFMVRSDQEKRQITSIDQLHSVGVLGVVQRLDLFEGGQGSQLLCAGYYRIRIMALDHENSTADKLVVTIKKVEGMRGGAKESGKREEGRETKESGKREERHEGKR
jgi:hypothetical protein